MTTVPPASSPRPSAPSPSSTEPARLLDDLLERVAGVLSGGAAAGEPSEGTDADGYARVRLGGDGRVAAIDLDPRLARHPARVAPAIVEAVNAAIDARPATSRHTVMTSELQKLQQESLAVTKELNASLLASLDALTRR